MQTWTVEDRYNNAIYLTEERWEHIQERHDELIGRLDAVLETIRDGQRRQEALEPEKYRYRLAFDDLHYGYNHIIVIVVFHYDVDGIPNNFTVTAWGAYIHPKN